MRVTHLALCLSLALLSGCQERKSTSVTAPQSTQEKVNIMMQEVTIKIGEQGEAWLKRYPELVKVQHPTPNVNFYEIKWDARPRGTVKIDHGKFSFVVEDVLSTFGTSVHELSSEGLITFSINSGTSVSDPGLISHDEARLKTYALLKKIEQAGWKITTVRGDPRISGKDRLNYVLNIDEFMALDTRYTPSLEEWMRINSGTAWNFYADHLYLKVSFTRERTLTDPNKPGSYLLSFDIKSEAENFRAYVGPDNRARWKELLPAELAPRDAERTKKETELKAKGIAIDESYQDPPTPNLK
jgi:hypothetical protein